MKTNKELQLILKTYPDNYKIVGFNRTLQEIENIEVEEDDELIYIKTKPFPQSFQRHKSFRNNKGYKHGRNNK